MYVMCQFTANKYDTIRYCGLIKSGVSAESNVWTRACLILYNTERVCTCQCCFFCTRGV